MAFEYDPNKSAENKRKHGIDFEDAQRLWAEHRMNSLVVDWENR
jgi:uncharacterized protein